MGIGESLHGGRSVLWFLYFAVALTLIHLPYLGLPFFWDELGQFVPAALDLYREGRLVPRTTEPNVHPPGVMLYLAGIWSLFGYSIISTRIAMLVAAAGCVLATFLLAKRLCGPDRRAAAFTAAALLIVSPLFYTQSMLAQLDMPAALFSLWALLWFLQGRYVGAVLVSAALVWTKETGIVVPLVLAAWLWRERKFREAAWFALLPSAVLGGWLIVLTRATGNPLGNNEFAEYNLFYPLHPVRLSLALARRFFYLVFENFHWIGWIAVPIAWPKMRLFRNRDWAVAVTVAAAHIVTVSVLGGATLERYLLPVLPLMFIAMAAAWSEIGAVWRRVGVTALFAGLLVSMFWNPLSPAPLENNLGMMAFVRLHQKAAAFVERHYPQSEITTAWPLSAALTRPDFGYVRKRVHTRRIRDFGSTAFESLDPGSVEVIVFYSRDTEAALFYLVPVLQEWRKRYYGYDPQPSLESLQAHFRLKPVASWSEGGQWIAVMERVQTR